MQLQYSQEGSTSVDQSCRSSMYLLQICVLLNFKFCNVLYHTWLFSWPHETFNECGLYSTTVSFVHLCLTFKIFDDRISLCRYTSKKKFVWNLIKIIIYVSPFYHLYFCSEKTSLWMIGVGWIHLVCIKDSLQTLYAPNIFLLFFYK